MSNNNLGNYRMENLEHRVELLEGQAREHSSKLTHVLGMRGDNGRLGQIELTQADQEGRVRRLEKLAYKLLGAGFVGSFVGGGLVALAQYLL